MAKSIKEQEPFEKDILNDEKSPGQFGKSELDLLNLIAQIIVEYVLNEEE